MSYKRYIRKFWSLIHRMWINGLIDKPDKFVAWEKLKIALTELENAFSQELKK